MLLLTTLTNACTLTDMEQDAFIPIDLDEYRTQLEKRGKELDRARRRVELTTDILKRLVVSAVAAGVSQSEAARLAGVRRQTVIEWLGK
jgi:hypothetical protein